MGIDTIRVENYFQKLNPDRRADLQKLRETIFNIIPGATESMKRRMPTYEYHGVFCSLASRKNYMTIYFEDVFLIQKYGSQLSKVNKGKCCVRFTSLNKLPLKVIKMMLAEAVRGRNSKGI